AHGTSSGPLRQTWFPASGVVVPSSVTTTLSEPTPVSGSEKCTMNGPSGAVMAASFAPVRVRPTAALAVRPTGPAVANGTASPERVAGDCPNGFRNASNSAPGSMGSSGTIWTEATGPVVQFTGWDD